MKGEGSGNRRASGLVEDPSGFRHYLLRLGIDLPGDTNWCPRSAAVLAGRHALPGFGRRAVWLDAIKGCPTPDAAAVGRRNPAGNVNLSRGLRLPLLGRTARAVRNRGCWAGEGPC